LRVRCDVSIDLRSSRISPTLAAGKEGLMDDTGIAAAALARRAPLSPADDVT
jgi:hypothetical protein